ncbi:MAG: acyltransferase [Methylocystis sp.]
MPSSAPRQEALGRATTITSLNVKSPLGEVAPTATTSIPSGDISTIQYLRGVAALMVVFAHANDQFKTATHVALRDIGWSGVDLFFLISGFVMTYTTATHNYTQRRFFLRRLARIAPLYWLMTLLTATLVILIPQFFQTTRFSWDMLIHSLAFIPLWDATRQNFSPLLHLGWTLDYEMYFYFWFTLLLWLNPMRRAFSLTAIFGIVTFIGSYLVSPSNALAFYADNVTFEFIFGCFIGAAYCLGWCHRAPQGLVVAALAISVPALLLGSVLDHELENRALLRGIPAAVIVFALISSKQARAFQSRWLHVLGDATYSIYLTHIFVVMGIHKIWTSAHIPTFEAANYLFVAICLVSAALVGVATYEACERRLNAFAKRLLAV